MKYMYMYKEQENTTIRIKAMVFYQQFKNYRENIGCPGTVSITTFGRDLKEYSGNGIEKKLIKGRKVYFLDYKKVNEYLKQKGYVEEIEEIEEENVESDEDY